MSAFLSPEWIDETHTILTALPAVGETTVTVQYAVGASPAGGNVTLHVIIENGAFRAVTGGKASDPDIKLTLGYDDAADLINGAETPDALFMRGALKVEGAHAVWLLDLRELRRAALEALTATV